MFETERFEGIEEDDVQIAAKAPVLKSIVEQYQL